MTRSQGSRANGPLRRQPIARVHAASHVAMEVSDLERSIAFYTEVLGLEIFHDDRQSPRQASVKGVIGGFGVELAQSREPLLAVTRRPAGAAPGRPCLSFSVSNIDEAFERLRSRGSVEASAPSEIRGVRFFQVFDPDGQSLELIQFPSPLKVLADLGPLARERG